MTHHDFGKQIMSGAFMDTIHKTKCVCVYAGFVCMGMELTLLSGQGITAGRAGSAFTVQIKTAEITATIENRFPPRFLNDIFNPLPYKHTQTDTNTCSHTHTHMHRLPTKM